jgi:hypothetical protein
LTLGVIGRVLFDDVHEECTMGTRAPEIVVMASTTAMAAKISVASMYSLGTHMYAGYPVCCTDIMQV